MTKLHELYKEYDEKWAKLVAIPIADRQAYAKEHKTDEDPWPQTPEVRAILDRCGELRQEISPLERDFEKEFEGALGAKIKANNDFAYKAYSCLCNVDWEHDDGSRGGESWRSAGGFIAEIRDCGENYMDFYCSGHEGEVDDEIGEIMEKLGWHFKEL